MLCIHRHGLEHSSDFNMQSVTALRQIMKKPGIDYFEGMNEVSVSFLQMQLLNPIARRYPRLAQMPAEQIAPRIRHIPLRSLLGSYRY